MRGVVLGIATLVVAIVGLLSVLIGGLLLRYSRTFGEHTEEVCCMTGDVTVTQCTTTCSSGDTCAGLKRIYAATLATAENCPAGTIVYFEQACTVAPELDRRCGFDCYVNEDCNKYTLDNPTETRLIGIIVLCTGLVLLVPYIVFVCWMINRNAINRAKEGMGWSKSRATLMRLSGMNKTAQSVGGRAKKRDAPADGIEVVVDPFADTEADLTTVHASPLSDNDVRPVAKGEPIADDAHSFSCKSVTFSNVGSNLRKPDDAVRSGADKNGKDESSGNDADKNGKDGGTGADASDNSGSPTEKSVAPSPSDGRLDSTHDDAKAAE
eukprot:gene14706-22498_t